MPRRWLARPRKTSLTLPPSDQCRCRSSVRRVQRSQRQTRPRSFLPVATGRPELYRSDRQSWRRGSGVRERWATAGWPGSRPVGHRPSASPTRPQSGVPVRVSSRPQLFQPAGRSGGGRTRRPGARVATSVHGVGSGRRGARQRLSALCVFSNWIHLYPFRVQVVKISACDVPHPASLASCRSIPRCP